MNLFWEIRFEGFVTFACGAMYRREHKVRGPVLVRRRAIKNALKRIIVAGDLSSNIGMIYVSHDMVFF
jgi:hypothetical protein